MFDDSRVRVATSALDARNEGESSNRYEVDMTKLSRPA